MDKHAIEIGILRADLERNPDLAKSVKGCGRELIIIDDFGLKVREALIHASEMMEALEPLSTQRDFGKRGKKAKRKKDWHR